MATLHTVDASVFLSGFNPAEDAHETSRTFLARCQADAVPIIVPALLMPEVAGPIRRGRGDASLAMRFVEALRRLPHLVIVPVDETLARQAASVAAAHGLRCADAAYAAVALRFGSALVTLDRQQRQRCPVVVATLTPEDALLALGSAALHDHTAR